MFLVSKQNLNASSWRISRTKFFQKRIRNEKVTPPYPPSRGGQELKKKHHRTLQVGSQTPQKLFVCCFVAITSSKIICRTEGGALIAL